MTDKSAMMFADLAAPFKPSEIDWRVGPTNKEKTKGQALAYLDARAVMNRLDAVCGPLWSNDYTSMSNGTSCCRIGIKFGDDWVYRANGAINFTESDNPDMKEMAEKGSYSDAFKRAAVLWGIGRYLYDLDSPWVEIVPAGRSYKFADGVRQRLDRLLAKDQGPAQSPPAPKVEAPKPKPEMTVGTWTDASISIVESFRAKSELTHWLGTNEAKLKELSEKSPKNADRLQVAIDKAYDKMNELVAG